MSALRSPSAHSPTPVTPSSVSTSTIVFVTDAVEPEREAVGRVERDVDGRRPHGGDAHQARAPREFTFPVTVRTPVALQACASPASPPTGSCSRSATARTAAATSPRTAPTPRSSCSRATTGSSAWARWRRSARSTPRPSPAGTRAGVAELAPLLAGRRPARAAARAARARRRDARPAVRRSRRSTWPSTTSPRRPPACRCARIWAAATARPSSCTARSRRPRPTSWRRARRPTSPRATGASRSRSAPIRRRTSSACTPCARPIAADVVLFCDANGAWTTGQARAFLRDTRDLEITMEQPCMSYEDCRARASRTARTRSCSTSASTRCRRCSPRSATASRTA